MAYKTFKKEKWLYLGLSIAACYLPFIIVTSIFFPMIEVATGFKIAIGLGIVIINTIPLMMGIFHSFFAHFPMLNIFAIVFLLLSSFFTMEIFQYYVQIFNWIEGAAALGSIASCILWGKFRKYSHWHESIKANVRSGAFVMKESAEDDKK